MMIIISGMGWNPDAFQGVSKDRFKKSHSHLNINLDKVWSELEKHIPKPKKKVVSEDEKPKKVKKSKKTKQGEDE